MNGTHYDFKKLAKHRADVMTQDALAERLGVSFVTISRLENGHGASYELLFRACAEIGLDIKDILHSSKNFCIAA